MIFVGFVIGFVVALTLAVWVMRPTGDYVVADKWWLENEERWEWLRRYEHDPDRLTATPGQVETLARNSGRLRKHRR